MKIRNCIRLLSLSFFFVLTGCRRDHAGVNGLEKDVRALKGNPIVTGTILHKITPVYPPVAKAAGVEGTVILHAIIATDGSVETLDAISGPVLLRGAAVDAVKQWVYAPYLINGVPHRVDTTVTVNFRFNHDSR